MGLFYQTFQIGPEDGSRLAEATAMVDTGSIYTLVPTEFLEDLGITPEWTSEFELADGREVQLGMAEVLITLNEEERIRVCIFGPPGCEPLLGADTLEGFGLMADPVNRRLVPARLFLA
jgi:clan AA aspartic protease